MSSPRPLDPPAPTCYRHNDRMTRLRCTRCDRPICPDCMRSAAVGQHCVDCARRGAETIQPVRRPRSPSAAPVVSYALIGLNVLAFPAAVSGALRNSWVLWPPAVADGAVYRLVTSAFLHYGLVHLLFNMWALYLVGPSLESLLGRWRFGALYGLSALGGSTAVYLLAPLQTATAGASGAIFGLFGAIFVVAKRLRFDTGWVAAVLVINLVFTFTIPNISWQGHVGGLLTGVVTAVAYVYPPAARRRRVQLTATVGLLMLFAALTWWRTAALAAQLGLS